MNKRYRLVVFDWEGTLSDTLGLVFHCVAEEARRLNFGEMDEELARQSVELGLVMAIKKVFPHLVSEQHEQLLNAVQQSLMSRQNEVYLIPGAKDIVMRLHGAGVGLAIATNKGQQGLQRALHSTGLDTYFSVTRSAGQAPSKPHPRMLQEIIMELGLSVQDALMVGDSVTDMEMANSVGMDAVGVNFNHQQPELLLAAGALAVFDDYRLLADYLHLPDEKDVFS